MAEYKENPFSKLNTEKTGNMREIKEGLNSTKFSNLGLFMNIATLIIWTVMFVIAWETDNKEILRNLAFSGLTFSILTQIFAILEEANKEK